MREVTVRTLQRLTSREVTNSDAATLSRLNEIAHMAIFRDHGNKSLRLEFAIPAAP